MKDQILNLLAEQIGVEPADLSEDDSLREDLHMSTADLAEIAEQLSQLGYEEVDLSEVQTVGELLEELNVTDEI